MKTTDSICTTEINASQMLRLSVATHSVYSTLHDFAVVVVVIVLWRSVSPAIDDGGLSIEFDFPFNSHAINMLEKHRKFSSLNVSETKMNQTTITTFKQSNSIEFYFVVDAYVEAIFLSL